MEPQIAVPTLNQINLNKVIVGFAIVGFVATTIAVSDRIRARKAPKS